MFRILAVLLSSECRVVILDYLSNMHFYQVFLFFSGGGEHAPVDHRAKRLWEEFSLQNPQWLMARLRRPAIQTLS